MLRNTKSEKLELRCNYMTTIFNFFGLGKPTHTHSVGCSYRYSYSTSSELRNISKFNLLIIKLLSPNPEGIEYE